MTNSSRIGGPVADLEVASDRRSALARIRDERHGVQSPYDAHTGEKPADPAGEKPADPAGGKPVDPDVAAPDAGVDVVDARTGLADPAR